MTRKPTTILKYIVIAAVILIAVFSLWDSGDTVAPENYAQAMKEYRQKKDEFMRTDDESPFLLKDIPYSGLTYYPVDENFRTQASVEPIKNGEIHELATSDGKTARYQEIAILHFDLKGSHEDLTLLQSLGEDDHLFLPFYDKTSAESTYGAGRYLEVEYEKGDSRIELDFNKAYNPYCAYTEGYSCPVPPPSNEISIAIRAGEKIYE